VNHLQDLSYDRKICNPYDFERRTFEKIDIGDKIQLHDTLHLCYRCVKVAEQLTDGMYTVINRGDASEISTYIGED
jgi:NADH-quinone oxidoreductase subunit G